MSGSVGNHSTNILSAQDGAGPVPDLLAAAGAYLAQPALVVITGPPGVGRSTLLRRLGAAFRGPVFSGGGLAMLRGMPLARAVRARLPVHDPALLAEAVKSRVRQGLLLLDDLQWADPLTVAALPEIAAHCRIAVTLRTPHRLPGVAEVRLRTVAAAWLPVPPLPPPAAAALVRQLAPGTSAGAVAEVVRRAGGVPLAVTALARHLATARPEPDSTSELRLAEPRIEPPVEGLGYAVATALADLARPARTAMAALGLLGRPASPGSLGAGVDDLVAAGLADLVDGLVAPTSPYVAELAAGLLEAGERHALHRRLAQLVPPREGARHLAAAGDTAQAYRVAVAAAGATTSTGERAELLLLACGLPGIAVDPATRAAAARAALDAGRPNACLRVLGTETDPEAAVLRGEARLQLGSAADAVEAVSGVPDTAPPLVLGARDRVRLLGLLDADPAATAGAGGDALAARWSAWLLVETLAADGRLAEAAQAARAAAQACAADLAYSWQTRFVAAELWCTALRGDGIDEVVRRAGDLTDRTLPALARAYAVAAASLAEADGGLLAPARARLAGLGASSSSAAAALDWVAREAAWLDGQPDLATAPATSAGAPPLVDGLRRITARWAAYDASDGQLPAAETALAPLPPVQETLAAWAGDPQRFDRAAAAWHGLARREEVRCLLAHGLLESDAERAVPPLLEAERLAEEAGLVVLLGRARRALRRHSVRRDIRGKRAGDDLSDRERDVLRLVAHGEPTRRIAGQLGISRETVETHIRSGMRKLGARTRTEAAALALEVLG